LAVRQLEAADGFTMRREFLNERMMQVHGKSSG
jgi:hypothetical protein